MAKRLTFGLAASALLLMGSVSCAQQSTAPAAKPRVVMALVSRDVWYPEYGPVRRLLEASGMEVRAAAMTLAPCPVDPRGGGTAVTPEVALADLKPEQFDVLLVLGATGQGLAELTGETPFSRTVRALAVAAAAQGKLVGGLCNGPALLAQAGLLRGKRATCYTTVADIVRAGGATLVNEPVVSDTGLVTCFDWNTPAPVVQAIVKGLPQPTTNPGGADPPPPVNPPTPPPPPPAGAGLRVLMVIANQDFYYREYGDTRRSLEQAGAKVTVAAGRRETCRPHGNSGQGPDGGLVMPDLTVEQAKMADYDALVFVGGWGAVTYEPTYTGVFDNPAYNVAATVRQAAGRLIEETVRGDKWLCAICHGVSILAWARIDGRSPIAGKTVSAYAGGSPGSTFQGTHYADNQASVRLQVERLAGARMVPSRSVGNPAIADDDVVVDGRVITAENYDSAREFGRQIAQKLKG